MRELIELFPAGVKGVQVIEHNPEGADRLTSDLVKAIRADKIKMVMELSVRGLRRGLRVEGLFGV